MRKLLLKVIKIWKKLDKEDFTIFMIITGILLMSLGVYLMGSKINPVLGKYTLIVGSGMFYVFTIVYAIFFT
ncbi:MAG: hypothetical protein J7K98_02005 [Candidatus Aenigmarchaeota archaeon]|nr:hypothetical protein [Candidatus Aenigmarchaeota archaeon]